MRLRRFAAHVPRSSWPPTLPAPPRARGWLWPTGRQTTLLPFLQPAQRSTRSHLPIL